MNSKEFLRSSYEASENSMRARGADYNGPSGYPRRGYARARHLTDRVGPRGAAFQRMRVARVPDVRVARVRSVRVRGVRVLGVRVARAMLPCVHRALIFTDRLGTGGADFQGGRVAWLLGMRVARVRSVGVRGARSSRVCVWRGSRGGAWRA